MIQKTPPKKLPGANNAKYYLLTLTLSSSKEKGRDSSLVQKCKNVMQPMFICTTYRVVKCLKGSDGKFRFESLVC